MYQNNMYQNKTTPAYTHDSDVNAWFSEDHLKGLCPKTFDSWYWNSHTEDWLVHFEWYCKATMIPETGQNRILYTGLLMIDNASHWYENLSEITKAMIDSQHLSAYQVFKFKFHQHFINTNDAKDDFDQIKNLLCQWVHNPVHEILKLPDQLHWQGCHMILLQWSEAWTPSVSQQPPLYC